MAFGKTSPIAETQQALPNLAGDKSALQHPAEHNIVKVAMCLQVKKAGPRTRDRSLNPDFIIYQFINLPGY